MVRASERLEDVDERILESRRDSICPSVWVLRRSEMEFEQQVLRELANANNLLNLLIILFILGVLSVPGTKK